MPVDFGTISRMGIQDRDYYREKIHQNAAASGPPPMPGASLSFIKQLGIWLVLAFALYGVFRLLQQAEAPPKAGTTLPAETPKAFSVPLPAAVPVVPAQQEFDAAAYERARKAHFDTNVYRPSPGCQPNPGTVDCANEYIRARRDFDAGRLR